MTEPTPRSSSQRAIMVGAIAAFLVVALALYWMLRGATEDAANAPAAQGGTHDRRLPGHFPNKQVRQIRQVHQMASRGSALAAPDSPPADLGP